jgi:tape measure domain-containing protein
VAHTPKDIESLQLQMSADIRNFEKAMQRMAEKTDRALRTVEQRASRGSANINRNLQLDTAKALNFEAARISASSSLSRLEAEVRQNSSAIRNSLQATAGALATVFAADSVANYADSYTRFTNSLKVAGLAGEDLAGVQENLYATAQKYGIQLESLGALYGRTAQGAKELGASQSDLQRFTEGVAAALKVQGGSEESSRGAILQLTQALGGAVVRAEEFNSINEGARPILQAVANNIDRFGGSVAKLRAEVLEGNVSSREFFQGILASVDELERSADQASLTISSAFQVLNNAIGKYIGETDQSLSATQRFSQGIILLSQNIDKVAPSIGLIAAVLAGRYATALAVSLGSTIKFRIEQARASLQSNAYSAALAENIGMMNAHATASARAAAATSGVGGAARVAGSALLGAFGGPIGLAVSAVAIALGGVAIAAAEAASRAAELDRGTKALKEQIDDVEFAIRKANAQLKGMQQPVSDAALKAAFLTGEQKKLADETFRVAAAIKAQTVALALKSAEEARTKVEERKAAADSAKTRTLRKEISPNFGGGTIGGVVPTVTGRDIAKGRAAAVQTPEGRAYQEAIDELARAEKALRDVQAIPLAGFIEKPSATKPDKKAAAAAARAEREAEKAARDSLRDDRRLEDDLYAAGDALLQAQRQRAMTAEEALKLELAAIDRAEAARKIDLDRDVADRNITAAERAELEEADKAIFCRSPRQCSARRRSGHSRRTYGRRAAIPRSDARAFAASIGHSPDGKGATEAGT